MLKPEVIKVGYSCCLLHRCCSSVEWIRIYSVSLLCGEPNEQWNLTCIPHWAARKEPASSPPLCCRWLLWPCCPCQWPRTGGWKQTPWKLWTKTRWTAPKMWLEIWIQSSGDTFTSVCSTATRSWTTDWEWEREKSKVRTNPTQPPILTREVCVTIANSVLCFALSILFNVQKEKFYLWHSGSKFTKSCKTHCLLLCWPAWHRRVPAWVAAVCTANCFDGPVFRSVQVQIC